ncbi:HdeA/HdeB family chaperone [Zavarzinia sp. CC-PAN008]|uniref:HdeA/HdeB family chaperone n=1 Tax=Zavarzinia sp. CC-PAN008 TaxID=3243332 RepID=UPI003F747ECD
MTNLIRRGFGAAILAVGAAMPLAQAQANVIDISTVTCNDLLTADEADRNAILFYIYGFDAGLRKDVKLNLQEVSNFSARLGGACATDRSQTVFEAIAKIAN